MINEVVTGAHRVVDAAHDLLQIARAELLRDAPSTPALTGTDGEKALRIRCMRESRYKIFEQELFGEPAWDILLDVFIAEERKGRLSVSAASSADHVAPTTGLRYLALLEEKGLLAREKDEDDGRRHWIVLTDRARDMMRRWLAQI